MVPQPSTTASRRAVLATGAASVATVAGCSALQPGTSMLGLALFNQPERPYTVELSLFEPDDEQSRSDARVYSGSIDVDPREQTHRERVAEAQRYLVQYELFRDNSRLTDEDHIHFYPDDDGDDESLAFNIHPPGTMTRRA